MITSLNTVCFLTCGIQPVESGHGITVKHPEVAIVTGQQAGLARCHNVIPDNVATRGGPERQRREWKTISQLNNSEHL